MSDFQYVSQAALGCAETLIPQWLPNGVREGKEWAAINPRRSDNTRGSFKVNLKTGAWADFSCGEKGGDCISLYAYIFGVSQIEALKVR